MRTIEDGIHTYDIYKEGTSQQKVGTKEFADAAIARIGQLPQHLVRSRVQQECADEPGDPTRRHAGGQGAHGRRSLHRLAGWEPRRDRCFDRRARRRGHEAYDDQQSRKEGLRNGNPDTYWSDHWCCRFEADGASFGAEHVVRLLEAADRVGFDVVKTEGLYTFNGTRGYSLAQGE